MTFNNDSPVEKCCILVAEPSLSNKSLASYIEQETKIISKASDLPNLQNMLSLHKNKEVLLLIDCHRQDADMLNQSLTVVQSLANKQQHIALYNVIANSEIETLIRIFHIKGLFNENAVQEQLIKGVRALFNGEIWLSRQIVNNYYMQKLKGTQKNTTCPKLTKREMDIIKLIASGEKNDDIADALCLSTHTVKTHLYRIYKKIQVENRIQAASWAIEFLPHKMRW